MPENDDETKAGFVNISCRVDRSLDGPWALDLLLAAAGRWDLLLAGLYCGHSSSSLGCHSRILVHCLEAGHRSAASQVLVLLQWLCSLLRDLPRKGPAERNMCQIVVFAENARSQKTVRI